MVVGLKAFDATKGSQSYLDAFRDSKIRPHLRCSLRTRPHPWRADRGGESPPRHALDAPRLDGVASIGIGLVLLLSSLPLARETKGLLIGESAHQRARCHPAHRRRRSGRAHRQWCADRTDGPESGCRSAECRVPRCAEYHADRNVRQPHRGGDQARGTRHCDFCSSSRQSATTWRRRIQRLAAASEHRAGGCERRGRSRGAATR